MSLREVHIMERQKHTGLGNAYLIQSIVLHVFVILLFITDIFPLNNQKINYIPAIKVNVVALPEKQIPQKIAPLSNRKTKKVEVQKNKSMPPPPSQPIKTEQKAQIKKNQAKQPADKKTETEEDTAVDYEQLYEVGQNAIERLKHLRKIEDMTQEQNVIKGNRLAPGTALQGIDKLDYDHYIEQLHLHIQSHWKLPQWLAVSDQLATIVKVYLDANGYVIERQLLESSGDLRFDQIVLSAIDAASPFPPPKDQFINIVKTGITLIAKP